jgi:hypothetical protein
MRISESDWSVFLGHAAATLAKFQVPEAEQSEVVTFVQSLKKNALNRLACLDAAEFGSIATVLPWIPRIGLPV